MVRQNTNNRKLGKAPVLVLLGGMILGSCQGREASFTPSKDLSSFETDGFDYSVEPFDKNGNVKVDGFKARSNFIDGYILTGYDRDENGRIEKLLVENPKTLALAVTLTDRPDPYSYTGSWRDAGWIQETINKR